MEGDFLALEELGLAFWCPSVMAPVELTEELIAGGTLAYVCNEDDSWRMSICYMLEDGSVLAFNFAPLTEELFVPVVGAMAKSIMPYAAE